MKKLLARLKTRKGIGMTEYLILLSLIAVAAIAVAALFGEQIKSIFRADAKALAGQEEKVGDAGAKMKTGRSDFSDFQKGAKK